MTPTRIDWLRVAVWTGLLLGLCVIANVAFWLLQRVWLLVGPWIMADVDRFTVLVGVFVVACVGVVYVMARKDNPSW